MDVKQTKSVLPKGRASTDDPRPVTRNTFHCVTSEIKQHIILLCFFQSPGFFSVWEMRLQFSMMPETLYYNDDTKSLIFNRGKRNMM